MLTLDRVGKSARSAGCARVGLKRGDAFFALCGRDLVELVSLDRLQNISHYALTRWTPRSDARDASVRHRSPKTCGPAPRRPSGPLPRLQPPGWRQHL